MNIKSLSFVFGLLVAASTGCNGFSDAEAANLGKHALTMVGSGLGARLVTNGLHSGSDMKADRTKLAGAAVGFGAPVLVGFKRKLDLASIGIDCLGSLVVFAVTLKLSPAQTDEERDADRARVRKAANDVLKSVSR